jgi:hypothetical protein
MQLREGKLAIADVELVATGENTLQDTRGNATVRVSERGGVIEMEVKTRQEPAFRLVKVTQVMPTDAELGQYAGSYTSPELGVNYQVAVANGNLVVKRRLQSDLTLVPTFKDAFGTFGTWTFTRDASGKVNGLLYSQGRVRGVRFARDS